MVEPIQIPGRLGQPCWTAETLEASIRTIAAMGDESAPRFLASHAPINHVDVIGSGKQTDQQIFERLTRLRSRENVVLVHGAPGTGKSHLINWIKLSFDHALSTGALDNIVPVLIRRRTGSLKDALEQLVQQLPEKFTRYLEPVRQAIDRISELEARQKLANAFYLELGVRWNEAGKEPLPRTIRNLSEAFHAEGFGQWLCRPGGVIDRNVQQLISPSDVREREGTPQFSADEFQITEPRLASRGLNTENVHRLIDEFMDAPKSAERAAVVCNEVLRPALRDLTGLGNQQLGGILRSIRQELRSDGKRLVLLIEDVSTLSVLDDEIVNAVEPQDDASLCDLTAVLGMTEQAFGRLRDNQIQRFAGSGFIVRFPPDGGASAWASDGGQVDRFIGRYLNTARLADVNVAAIAAERQRGQDVEISACEGCPVRETCHKVFGTVELDKVVIGLFPFRPGTAFTLLQQLDVRMTGVLQTQRSLLDYIAKPVLYHTMALAEGAHPALTLPVESPLPKGWQTFTEHYLGGWSVGERERVRMLAQAWAPAADADELAAALQPLLAPFGMQAFSSAVDNSRAPKVTPAKLQPVSPLTPVSPAARAHPGQAKLENALQRLDRWVSNEPLLNPGDLQGLVINFLKGALPFDDVRDPARSAHRLVKDATARAIRFEGSATQAAAAPFAIELPRTQETRDLVAALAHYRLIGDDGWNFPDGERHKRMVARWLRTHEAKVLAQMNPPDLDPSRPVLQASSFLAVAAMIERRADLPNTTSDIIASMAGPNSARAAQALSPQLAKLFADLPERRHSVQQFLFAEATVPQGSGGINVIDPIKLLSGVPAARAEGWRPGLPAEYFESFWKTRYSPLEGLDKWGTLPEALVYERDAIGALVAEIDNVLQRHGFEAGHADIPAFFESMRALCDTLRTTKQWQVEDLDAFRRDKLFDRGSTMAETVLRAAQLVTSGSERATLLFDPEQLSLVKTQVERCDKFVARVRTYAQNRHTQLTADGDPEALRAEIVASLEAIAASEAAAAA